TIRLKTGGAGLTVMLAVAFFCASTTLLAVTYAVFVAVTAGAVYSPELVTVPPVVDQVTAVLLVPATIAVNCFVAPEYSVAVIGEIATATLGGLPANACIAHKTNPSNKTIRFIVPSNTAGMYAGYDSYINF